MIFNLCCQQPATVMQKDSIEALHQYRDPLVQEACLSVLLLIIIIVITVMAYYRVKRNLS